MYAVLSNKNEPDFGVVTIPLPIPEKEYANCMELLASMEIGGATEQDCLVEEIHLGYETLRRLEGQNVNVDELDFLAKVLDSYCEGQDDKFEAMAYQLDLREIRDFINLSLCCDKATVITNFKDLKSVGQDHFLTLHGGVVPIEDFQAKDMEKLAWDLIASGQGKITPYGVVFDNGMELEQAYTGGAFPGILYKPKIVDLTISPPTGGCGESFLQLPMPGKRLERMLERGGFKEGDEFPVRFGPEMPPAGAAGILLNADYGCSELETVRSLNRMAVAIERLDAAQRVKLDAVVRYVQPEFPFQIQRIAEHLDFFEFVPGVKTNEEYGKYMIQQSGEFEYDPDLEPWYDYQKYGDDHLAWRNGQFNELGYVGYAGDLSLDELMMQDSPEPEEGQGLQMGGLCQ